MFRLLWEDIKASLSPEERERHPARYCLVELENIFDEGLLYEPIHRVFFDVDPNVFDDAAKQNAKLYVPRGQMFNYKRRLEWRDFKNIQEY